MEPHRTSGSLDSRLQRGYVQQQQHSPRASPDSSAFGVRVQIQGIKGHPYVILNNGGQQSHRDVSVVTHQSDYGLAPGRRGSPLADLSVEKRLANRRSQYGDSPPETGESQRTAAASSAFHYQKHPELLRPYDPDNNDLNQIIPLQTAPVARLGQLHAGLQPEKTQAAQVSKARIPLPAEGPELDPSAQIQAPGPAVPARSPNSVDRDPMFSVGKLIDRFNITQRKGRCGPRNRLDPEERRRSRSADSSQTSDSSSPSSSPSSPSSSPSSSLKAVRGETPGGTCAADPLRARFSSREPTLRATFSSREPTLAGRREESKSTSQLYRGQRGQEAASPPAAMVLHRVEKTSSSSADLSDERDTQVTPDLLKGQQELPAESNEDTAKQMLFTLLKDGTSDNDSTTQKKVSLVLDSMNKLKWKTFENVEEEDKNYAVEVQALQEKGAALEEDVAGLQKQLQVETKNVILLAKACEKARAERKNLQEELVKSQEQLSKLRDRLADVEAELQSTKQELAQVKAERDRFKTEMKDLQQQLSEMHDELDQVKQIEVENTEKEVLLKEMDQLRVDFQEVLHMQGEQEEVLHWRERELIALKGALKEEVETHDDDVTALKEQYEQEVQKLLSAVEQAKESNTSLGQEKTEVEEERGEARVQVTELRQARDELRGRVEELENRVDQLNSLIQESRALEKLLGQRANHLEREKEHVEETLTDVRAREEEMCQSNQALAIHLEDVQSKLTKMNHEHRELKEKLREEKSRLEELWRSKNELQEERRLQDRTVEQLQRKMCNIMEDCEAVTDKLQSQIDEARERSMREQAELRRQLQEKGVEVEKSQQMARALQEELLPVEEDLQRCRGEWEEAERRGRQLQQRVEELEESSSATLEERARHVKLMESHASRLEEDLSDERSTADRLMERFDKNKEQMDQMRSELMQERAARQDVECDKTSLERQNKDLHGRVSHLEGSQRTSQDALVSKLNGRLQELEERLQVEERENNALQQANRKLERKMKEMKMQVDEEHMTLQSQRDQLTQRVKTAKRQMDEAEGEIERVENAKKKLQRDLDEQIEANEELNGQLGTLRNEMRRKKKSSPFTMIVEDGVDDMDDFGSD